MIRCVNCSSSAHEIEDCTVDTKKRPESVPASDLDATKFVLAERERELLESKGPCSGAQGQRCRLHYAHSGPCDTREA